jgi:tRNA modification GTPase
LLLAEGELSTQIQAWEQRLLELSARAEAAIDYVDEGSVDAEPRLCRDCGSLAAEIAHWLQRPRAEPLRDGVRVVIAGPTNAGKSSLLNALAGYERAIVTDVPGTTRDQIEVPLALSGVPLRLTDTAGLRETGELVERIGVDRARALIDIADVLVWLGDPDDAPAHPRPILVHAKADLADRRRPPPGSLALSAMTGEGLGQLSEAVVAHARALLPAEGEVALNARQAQCLEEVLVALEAAGTATEIVLVAESLRSARSAFDRLTGRAGVEDLLDALFGRFCLGK